MTAAYRERARRAIRNLRVIGRSVYDGGRGNGRFRLRHGLEKQAHQAIG